MSHPSWIELDAHHLGASSAAVAAHSGGCAECRAYLERLSEPLATPAWLAQAGRPRRRAAWLGGAGFALAASLAVAAVAFWPSGVREKSAPAVMVQARHDDRWAIWDGVTGFVHGDAVRFEVFAAQHRHVAIVGRGPNRLAEYPLLPGETVELPLTFGFTPEPGDEQVWLVLSTAPLDDSALYDATRRVRRDEDVWTVALTLPKEPMR